MTRELYKYSPFTICRFTLESLLSWQQSDFHGHERKVYMLGFGGLEINKQSKGSLNQLMTRPQLHMKHIKW